MFLMAATINLSRPMVSYRALELGIPVHLLGVVAAAYVLVPLLLTVVIGRVVDRHGTLWIQLAGATLFVTGAVGLGLTQTLTGLILMSGLLGCGHIVVVVCMQTAIAAESDASSLDLRFARYTLAASFGAFIGPLIGGAIAAVTHDHGARAPLLASGAIAAVSFFTVLALRPPNSGRASMPSERVSWMRRRELFGRGSGGVLLVSFSVAAVMDTLVIYLPALGQERGWSIQAVSVLLAVYGIASMLSRFALDRMVVMFGRKRLLVAGTVIAGAALVVVGSVPNIMAAYPAAAVGGYALGMCAPLTMAWLASETRTGTRGTVMSVRLAINRLGQLVLPATAGLVASAGGAAAVLYIAGGWVGLSAVSLSRSQMNRESETLPAD
jgi:MFS family permease